MRGKCMDDIEEGEATHSRRGEGTVEGRLVAPSRACRWRSGAEEILDPDSFPVGSTGDE
jgi:hypothetical protein